MAGTMPAIERLQRTILVVDDDPGILKFVSGLFDGDYHVLTASSGAAALQQSRDSKGQIHLILSDFQMPAMSGIELATSDVRGSATAQGIVGFKSAA